MSADLSEAETSAVLERLAAGSAAQAGSENFPVALRVLPKAPRDKLLRAYSFARFVDDVGDEAPGDRLALLDVIDADVRALPSGTATLPVVRALRPLVECLPVRQARQRIVGCQPLDRFLRAHLLCLLLSFS